MAPHHPAAVERWLNEDAALGPWAGFSCPIRPRISSNPSSIRFWIETESTAEGPGRIGFRQPGIVHVCQCVPAEKRGACERGGGIMHKLQIKAKEKRNGKNVFVLQNPVCGNHVWFSHVKDVLATTSYQLGKIMIRLQFYPRCSHMVWVKLRCGGFGWGGGWAA